jgi:hypothetical protein
MPDEASDRSLVRRFRAGQAGAPTQLYLRYAQRLHALATRQASAELVRRVDPEDIVQSCQTSRSNRSDGSVSTDSLTCTVCVRSCFPDKLRRIGKSAPLFHRRQTDDRPLCFDSGVPP